jgi:hypothetical protein
MMKRLPAAAGFLRLLPVAAVLTSACSSFGFSGDPSPAPTRDVVIVASPDPSPESPREIVAVPTAPAAPAVARDPALERQIVGLELKLLEKEAQVEELRAQLDDARREVVRAMARLRTLATRDEAVSGMAEAEVALQSLLPTAAAQAVVDATELIELATAELDRQNYGGALYLANQAKSVAAAARGQLAGSDQVAPRPDELPFALPLHLQTTTAANVREGPGTGFTVRFTLPSGAPLVAYSSAEQWLRIADDSGRSGWIYQRLIQRRP